MISTTKIDYERLFLLSPDMLCVANFEGYLLQVNPAFTDALGYHGKELLSKPLIELVHPDDRPATAEKLQITTEGEAAFTFTNRYLHQNGSYRNLKWITRADLSQSLIYAVIKDMTTLPPVTPEPRPLHRGGTLTEKNDETPGMQQAIEKVTEDFQQLMYAISHDLQAPLRHIEGFTEWILEEESQNLSDSGEANLKKVIGASQRMSHMIEELLHYSRSYRQQLKPEWIDLSAILQRAINAFSSQTQQRNIRWQMGQLPRVYADPDKIFQVFQHLLSNAVKFTGPKKDPAIKIWTEESDRYYTIYCQDNGIGFNPNYTEKLFIIFSRLHLRSNFPGNGIGLAHSKLIIEKHGGRVGAQGKVNEGATFFFTLPKTLGNDGIEKDHTG